MKTEPTAAQAQRAMRALGNATRAASAQRYFKTGKGEYGEGDRFLGVSVPETRKLAKEFRDLPIPEAAALLDSPYNEERVLGLLIWGARYSRGDEKTRRTIYSALMRKLRRVNNWNLVDTAAPMIVGPHLLDKDRKPLYRLARSKNLWERRTAIISTYAFIRQRDFADTLRISELLLGDKHDLLHKACGWMLRELGHRDRPLLEKFLKKHLARMPRTMLRYAIERFPEEKRKAYLKG